MLQEVRFFKRSGLLAATLFYVQKYNAFSSTVLLVNTLLWQLSLWQVEFGYETYTGKPIEPDVEMNYKDDSDRDIFCIKTFLDFVKNQHKTFFIFVKNKGKTFANFVKMSYYKL